ncbi:MAG TPA: holo-ACP synthase [Solirubrobacteraceae bacterium]|jgi:holo-[acyl-carrier protein] synthase
MIVGVGTDLVDLARFEQVLQRSPGVRGRLFTPDESVLPMQSLAARFAAKEALAKALGAPGGLGWHDVEVVGPPPRFELRGTLVVAMDRVGAVRSHLSMSHDGGFAMAFVVLESGDPR